MKIITIHFSYLRNEAHYQFFLLLKKLFESHSSVANIVAAQLSQLYALILVEGQLVDTVRTSEYTRQLVDIDRRLDRAIGGLILAIEAALHHPDPNFVKAAERLQLLLKAFRDRIGQKAYEEESGAVKILISDLQSTYAPQVSTLSLGVWVTEIAAAQAAFEQIFLLRSAEYVARPQGNLKEVRREIEGVYRQTTERIDAYTVLNGTNTTGDFISKLNDEIAYFNEHNRHHHAPRDISLATVASIPDQPWDGQPVTPLPAATDENGAPLVFARDYDLTYRHNDAPGNATLTLHGKSAWKGRKTVSFTITENEK
jgi:hypothetical protein